MAWWEHWQAQTYMLRREWCLVHLDPGSRSEGRAPSRTFYSEPGGRDPWLGTAAEAQLLAARLNRGLRRG